MLKKEKTKKIEFVRDGNLRIVKELVAMKRF